jgi:hypothetical protein
MIAKQTEPAVAKPGVLIPTLPVMVVLGNPRNPDCSQHGICRIYEAGNTHEACDCAHQTFAWLSITETGTICLVFHKNFIRPESFDTHFSKGQFKVEYSYEFPESLIQRMQIGRDAAILPGSYPVFQYSDQLEVRFEC